MASAFYRQRRRLEHLISVISQCRTTPLLAAQVLLYLAATTATMVSSTARSSSSDIRIADRITSADLLSSSTPLLVRSASFNAALATAGLTGFNSLRDTFGTSDINVNSEVLGDEVVRVTKGREWIDEIRAWENDSTSTLPVPGRPSYADGVEFFSSRPKLHEHVGTACAQLLPSEYRDSFAHSLDMELDQIVLWAGLRGGVYAQLHSDTVPGNLLWHLEGRKRVHLYSRADADKLYMEPPNWNDK